MYISHIALRNVRSFKRLDLNLVEGPHSSMGTPRLCTVVIGKNGTGKTTLLRAIAIGLADEKDASGLLAEPIGTLVSEGVGEATITIRLHDDASDQKMVSKTVIGKHNGEDTLTSKTLHDDSSDLDTNNTTNILVCAYGISRAIEGQPTGRSYRVIDSVYNLFQYETPLIPTELAYFRLKNNLGRSAWRAMWIRIRAALGLDPDVEINTGKRAGLVVSGTGVGKNIPIEAWADGYRRTLAWILDLYTWAMLADRIDKTTGAIKGIVLIDEIEQHLHPTLQIEKLSRLTVLLQDAQVIATTHSPFIALGVRTSELVTLRRENHGVFPVRNVPDFYSYSVEDISLDKDLFDTEVYNSELSAKLTQYRRLIQISPSKRTLSEQDELRVLAKELSKYELLRAGRQEISAFDELLAILRKHNL